MFIAANVLEGLAVVIKIALDFYFWIIIIRALISWVNPDPWNPIVRALISITEPVLYPIRRRLPFSMGIDISPIVVILLIYFLQIFLVGTLQDLAIRMH